MSVLFLPLFLPLLGGVPLKAGRGASSWGEYRPEGGEGGFPWKPDQTCGVKAIRGATQSRAGP
jgi:hypothetical protein